MAVVLGDAVARLVLDTSNFNQNLAFAQQSIANFGSDALSAWGSVGYAMSSIGNSMTTNVTTPIIQGAKSALQSYRDYESAFTGVRKTLDTTSEDYKKLVEQLGGEENVFELLSGNVVDMTQETASTAEEIAKVMEWAGQLGVPLGEGGEAITDFTKTMIMLGDTTNVSSDEAAESLAKLMNITRTSWDETENLGSSIVHLGNNFATTENDIINMSTRLAAAGATAGLSTQEILALATAASSVGMRAEAGGSALSTAITMIEKILNGAVKNAEDKQTELARVTGVTTEEFYTLWKEKPIEALTLFIDGLHNLDEQGDSSVAALANLDMSGVRVSNVLKALALNTDLMDEALSYANTGWEENIALSKEASLRYETLDSQITQTKELWKEVQREFAELLIPSIKEILEYIKSALDWLKGLDDSQKQMIIRIAEVAAVLGPILVILGNLITSITSIVTLFNGISDGVRMGIDAFYKLGEGAAECGSIFSRLGGLLTSIMEHPFLAGAAVVAIMAIVAAVIDLWNNNEQFRENVIRIWDSIKEVIIGVWEALKPVFQALIDIFMDIVVALEPLISTIAEILAPLLEALAPLIVKIVEVVAQLMEIVLKLIEAVLMPIIDIVAMLIELIGGPLASLLTNIVGFIAQLIAKGLEFVSILLTKIIGGIQNFINMLKEAFEMGLGQVVDFVKNVIDTIVDIFKWLKYVLIGDPIVIDLINGIMGIFKNGFDFILDVVKTVLYGIVDFFKWLVENAISLVGNFIDFFRSGFEDVGGAIVTLFDGIRQTVEEFGDRLIETAVNIGKGFVSGILGAASSTAEFFENFMKTAIDTISSFISTFKDKGAEILNSFWDGLKEVWGDISKWFSSAFDFIEEKIASILGGISSIINGVREIASGIVDKAKDFISGSHARGLDYVPYNGYIAELHKGERVLTKQENEEYNKHNSNSGGDTYNFYDTKSDPYAIAREIKRVKKELEYA